MEYTEYEPGRFGCPDCGAEQPPPNAENQHDHERWCRNPENPYAVLEED